ncbi:MAG: aminoacyl-tRNA hydrolase, partial [Lachnospiraceae bacterium]
MILFDRLKNIFGFNKDRKESKMKLIVGLGNPG